MIRAEVKNEPHGYVVRATIDNKHYPLRNFGDYRSAAMEFRDYINHCKLDADKLRRQVRLWANTYKPDVLYTYPTILKNGNIALIKQRKY